jgi:HAD superfamily hydrolase (TIGR01459 family)
MFTKYDDFIFDIWGVIHNGHHLLPGVLELITKLQEKKKGVYFLSNAPRPAAHVHQKLVELGLNIPVSSVLTSGEFFLHYLANNKDDLGSKVYVIGLEKNDVLLAQAGVEIVDNVLDADYFLMLAFADGEDELKYYTELMNPALKNKLKFICVNPDKVVVHGNDLRYCQGYFAQVYEEMGGEVLYYGKPHRPIYEHLFAAHRIQKQRALIFGDSLETDIKGAGEFGVDSVFLLTGIHKGETDVANLLKMHTTIPTYIYNGLTDLL